MALSKIQQLECKIQAYRELIKELEATQSHYREQLAKYKHRLESFRNESNEQRIKRTDPASV